MKHYLTVLLNALNVTKLLFGSNTTNNSAFNHGNRHLRRDEGVTLFHRRCRAVCPAAHEPHFGGPGTPPPTVFQNHTLQLVAILQTICRIHAILHI
jgi:hypothetical protein